MSDLFQFGYFVLHSGFHTAFKIDCDALSDSEIKTLGWVTRQLVGDFKQVYGIPTGGLRLAKELEFFADPKSSNVLIVDDVFTTGRSFIDFERWTRGQHPDAGIVGVTIFARNPTPEWVHPIFTLNSQLALEQENDDDEFATPRVLQNSHTGWGDNRGADGFVPARSHAA